MSDWGVSLRLRFSAALFSQLAAGLRENVSFAWRQACFALFRDFLENGIDLFVEP